MTATVFDLLSYLTGGLAWEIIKRSDKAEGDCPEIVKRGISDQCQTIIDVEFWPHWDGRDTEGKKFVEPDVFFRFRDFDVIIEAKRTDQTPIKEEQAKNEVTVYKTEYSKYKRDVGLMLVGDSSNISSANAIGCDFIIRTNWTLILKTLNEIITEAPLLSGKIDQASIRIIENEITGLRLFGYFSIKWLTELIEEEIADSHIMEKSFIYEN